MTTAVTKPEEFDGSIKHVPRNFILVDGLINAESKNTDMITLYIPAKRNIHNVIQQLRREEEIADGIKSKTVRHNVKHAIRTIIERILTQYAKTGTPKNGVVFFARGDTGDTISFEPKIEVTLSLYRCDNKFYTDPIYNQLYGVYTWEDMPDDWVSPDGKYSLDRPVRYTPHHSEG